MKELGCTLGVVLLIFSTQIACYDPPPRPFIDMDVPCWKKCSIEEKRSHDYCDSQCNNLTGKNALDYVSPPLDTSLLPPTIVEKPVDSTTVSYDSPQTEDASADRENCCTKCRLDESKTAEDCPRMCGHSCPTDSSASASSTEANASNATATSTSTPTTYAGGTNPAEPEVSPEVKKYQDCLKMCGNDTDCQNNNCSSLMPAGADALKDSASDDTLFNSSSTFTLKPKNTTGPASTTSASNKPTMRWRRDPAHIALGVQGAGRRSVPSLGGSASGRRGIWPTSQRHDRSNRILDYFRRVLDR